MKLLSVILLTSSIFSQISDDVNLSKAISLYRSDLFNESKVLLIDMLYDEGDTNKDEILFHLGFCMLLENKVDKAVYHWRVLINKYPESPFSIQVKNYSEFTTRLSEGIIEDKINDILFMRQLSTIDLLLPFLENKEQGITNKKFRPLWSIDVNTAIKYLDYMVATNTDTDKLYTLKRKIFDIYLLELVSTSYSKRQKYFAEYVLTAYNSLETLAKSDNKYLNDFVEATYSLGVALSESNFLTGKLSPTQFSSGYFRKVIELSKDYEMNIYKILSESILENNKSKLF